MRIEGDAKLIASAFVKARAAMSATVKKDKKGNYGDYATLAALVEATAEHFASNGLAIVQEASTDEAGLVIETWLVHESGALMQFTPLVMPLTDRRPQAVGSAITYGRRYALAAICGLAPDDDDGQAAQDAETRARSAQKGQDARAAAQQAPRTNSTPNAPQQPATQATDDGDNPFEDVDFGQGGKKVEVLSEAQHKRLHALGTKLYGSSEWEEQRPKLVQAVSKGAVSSSKELTPAEADKLIAGIEKKIKEADAIRAQQAQAVAA